jgi:hypothetical protein
MKRICLTCNKSFTTRWSRKTRCDACRKRVCSECGKDFIVTDGQFSRFLCSSKCTHDRQKIMFTGIGNPFFKERSRIICMTCKKEFYVYPHLAKTRRYCSIKCRPIWNKGKTLPNISRENHPNWRGGTSRERYPLGWNTTYKEQIRQRDFYKCRVCGCPEVENGRRLPVHHIDYNKNNLSPSNLVSLCSNCHPKTNFNRERWIAIFLHLPLFQSLQ